MSEILLYHGSKEEVVYPEIRITRYTKDFSWGFYCTNNYQQAYRWADRRSADGLVNVYRYVENPDLKILRFPEMSDEWLDFIAKCRAGETHPYDIVEGPMADDTIWDYVNGFTSGQISREAFWALAKFKHPTHQISFHTVTLCTAWPLRGVTPSMTEKQKNDVLYVCSLIETIARKTKNHRQDVIRHFTKADIERQLRLAEVNHCLSFEQVSDELIEDLNIPEGDFDTAAECRYTVPSATSIGMLYQGLVLSTMKDDDAAQAILDVFSSFITDEISDFNSNVYYTNPDYLRCSYLEGKMLA